MTEVGFQTSGTSGKAKCIVRTEASLQADAAALVRQFPEFWATHLPVVATIPRDHMYGALWRVRAPALANSPVDAETILSEEGLIAAAARYGRFLLVTTPSFLEKLLEQPNVSALKGSIAGVVTSGSLLRSAAALAAADALGVCPTEVFGSTETGTVAFRRQTEGATWTLVDGVSATVDHEGRLVVQSPYAMSSPYVMSDAVEFVDARRFLLKGRTDRRVKILESFVSLPEVERALEGHPLVERAMAEAVGDDIPRLGALVVLTHDARMRLAVSSHRELARELRRDLLPKVESMAFPRRIRFVHALPVDSRGKTTAADVRNELLAWCREPVVCDWRQDGAELSARLVFTADLECFDGHFPGFPILPGVAQLYFLRHFARQAFSDFPDAATYRRLKFQKVVLPGRDVRLTVRRRGDGGFEFRFDGASGVYSSGIVERRTS